MWMMMLIMAMPLVGLVFFELWPLAVALPIYLTLTAISLVFDVLMMKAMRQRVRTGLEAIVGRHVRVLSWQGSDGQVSYQGEIWSAHSPSSEDWTKGQEALVEDVDGLVLVVRDASPPEALPDR